MHLVRIDLRNPESNADKFDMKQKQSNYNQYCSLKPKCFHINMPLTGCFFPLILIFFISGCSSVVYTPEQEAKFLKPTIAVLNFENRAPSAMQSQIGSGMAEQLTERLMATKRYVVMERQYFGQILRELNQSQGNMFRDQGRLQMGQLKHVKYLIRGVITDFGHVETTHGLGRVIGIFGPTTYSVVAATLTVVDVQSGQTMASISVEGKVKTTNKQDSMKDNNIAFGGHAFYKTTLGRATNEMLDKAVWEITQVLAEKKFHPKVARVDGDMLYITGGEDRMIESGDMYVVRDIPKSVIDPDTGDLLGNIPGQFIGKVQILNVSEKYSFAKIIFGDSFAEGQVLYKPEDDPVYNSNPEGDPKIPVPFFKSDD